MKLSEAVEGSYKSITEIRLFYIHFTKTGIYKRDLFRTSRFNTKPYVNDTMILVRQNYIQTTQVLSL